MVHRRTFLAGSLLAGAAASGWRSRGHAADLPEPEQQQALAPLRSSPFRLEAAERFDRTASGVAVSPNGRVFVCFPRWAEDSPVSVAEVRRDGRVIPYPDARWNAWRNGSGIAYAPRDHFVSVHALVADTRGNLWVLDAAAPRLDAVVSGGPKLMRIELATGKVVQVVRFGEQVAPQGSCLNDLCVADDGATAFISDSGARGALLVVDLESGKTMTRLEGHPSTAPEEAVEPSVDGRPIRRPDGRPLPGGAAGLALSPDGSTLFWQPLAGRTLYSIDTDVLSGGDPEAAERAVVRVGRSCVADALLMSRDGQLYLTSPEDRSIKVWTGEAAESVLADPRLNWPGSLAEGSDGTIYVTAASALFRVVRA